MEKLVNDHYVGSKAKDYNANRKNGKWYWEQGIVEKFIKNNSDITTIIDAPLGTNRFSNVFETTPHVKSVYGYELSDDMIAEAKREISTKLEIFKWDLVNDDINKSADLTIICRMLNLFSEDNSISILENVLQATDKYCIFTLRSWDKDPILVQNKIHVQTTDVFKAILDKYGFEIIDNQMRQDGVEGENRVYTVKKVV